MLAQKKQPEQIRREKIMNYHSESIWVCHNHREEVLTQTKVTYQDISEEGIPVCTECGEKMTFSSEHWITNRKGENHGRI